MLPELRSRSLELDPGPQGTAGVLAREPVARRTPTRRSPILPERAGSEVPAGLAAGPNAPEDEPK